MIRVLSFVLSVVPILLHYDITWWQLRCLNIFGARRRKLHGVAFDTANRVHFDSAIAA